MGSLTDKEKEEWIDRDVAARATLQQTFVEMFVPKIAPEELKKFNDWKEEYRKERGMETFSISLKPDMDPNTTADEIIAEVLEMERLYEAGKCKELGGL